MKKIQLIWPLMKESASKNFKSSTITFLLIMLVVNGFQMIFGPENMVLGIIIGPLMLVLTARDMTAHPVKHFFRQALLLCAMASAACFSLVVSVPAALLIHVTVVFLLLYTYTCDCGDHIYFQYVLGYLFLIFIGPISPQQLPTRLFGMVTGAGCLLLYQITKGRHRVTAVTRNSLLLLLDDTTSRIEALLCGSEPPKENAKLDNMLKAFSQTMEHRRKTTLGLSDASMATIETVLSLEKLNVVLRLPNFVPTEEKLMLLKNALPWMDYIRSFILRERNDIPQIQRDIFTSESSDAEQFYQWLVHLCTASFSMLHSENHRSFRKTNVSLWVQLKIIINFSPVRFAYALRLSGLLALGILFVQSFHLEYGKWLLFTIASVSLPYSDEVGTKAKKRFFATLIGGAASFLIFSLIPSTTGKIIVMVASGYLSCFLTDYLHNFSCATVGALGGAIVAMTSGGIAPIGSVVLVRIICITVGILIAIAFNCCVFPLNKEMATRNLAQKYIQITQAVSQSYQKSQPDLQLHYYLLLRMKRLENKLLQNAKSLDWKEVHTFLMQCQMDIWHARKAKEDPIWQS